MVYLLCIKSPFDLFTNQFMKQLHLPQFLVVYEKFFIIFSQFGRQMPKSKSGIGGCLKTENRTRSRSLLCNFLSGVDIIKHINAFGLGQYLKV